MACLCGLRSCWLAQVSRMSSSVAEHFPYWLLVFSLWPGGWQLQPDGKELSSCRQASLCQDVANVFTRWRGIWAAPSGAPLNSRNSFTTACIIYWPREALALSLSTSFLTGRVTASRIVSPGAKTAFSLLVHHGEGKAAGSTPSTRPRRPPRTFLPSNRLSTNSLYLYFPRSKKKTHLKV